MQQTSVVLTAIHRCSATTLKVSPGPSEVRGHSATPLHARSSTQGASFKHSSQSVILLMLILISGDALVMSGLLMSWMEQSFLQKVHLAHGCRTHAVTLGAVLEKW